MHAPALSVVIATFDGAEHLGEQLDALAGETVPGGFEVVVADNGSTDGTPDVARAFATRLDLQVVDAADGSGQAHARNVGAAAARADRLVFLDQDDVIGSGYLRAMQQALAEHPLVAARMDTTRLNPEGMTAAREVVQAETLPRDPVPWGYGCTLGVTRSEFERVGGFAVEQVGGAEDIDLCWRLHDVGVEVVFVPDALLHYRLPTSLDVLFRQGRRYGRAGILLYARRDRRDPHSSFDMWLRGTAGALRLLVGARTRPERGRALFLLGRRIGQLEGELRTRVDGVEPEARA
jgi:GT2 family glycosyltransferase